MPPKEKSERLAIFLQRLGDAAPAQDHDEAYQLLSDTLNNVEDQFSGVPANFLNWESDGRMYPPQEDRARACPELPGTTVYRSAGHHTYIGARGEIAILHISSGKILLNKAGADGILLELTKLDG